MAKSKRIKLTHSLAKPAIKIRKKIINTPSKMKRIPLKDLIKIKATQTQTQAQETKAFLKTDDRYQKQKTDETFIKTGRFQRGTTALKDNGIRTRDKGHADVKMEVDLSRIIKRNSPRQNNQIYKYASGLFIDNDHDFLQERVLVQKFCSNIEQVSNQKEDGESNVIYGKYAIYVKPILRYKHQKQRDSHMNSLKKLISNFVPYTGQEATSLGSLHRNFKSIFGQQSRDMEEWVKGQKELQLHDSNYKTIEFSPKPIIVLVGGEINRQINDLNGHCNVLVLFKDNDGNFKSWLKDCRPIYKLTVTKLAVELLKLLKINYLQIIPSLWNEVSPNCLLESVRFAAKVMDSTINANNMAQFPQITFLRKQSNFANEKIQKEINGANIYGLIDIRLVGDLKRCINNSISKFHEKTYLEWKLKNMDENGTVKFKLTKEKRNELYLEVAKCKENYESRFNF